ncbi:MAG: hypothetical protein LUE65_03500 [Clostridiales bacterium]|nr:hypothetical protein [Clostridiales bacterium]
MKRRRKAGIMLAAAVLAGIQLAGGGFCSMAAETEEVTTTETGSIGLNASIDLAALLASGKYTLKKAEQSYLTVECYEIEKVQYTTTVVDDSIQYMNIWIPKEYVNADGSFNWEAQVNGYTASTAPVIFRNNCSGWMSSSADNDSENSIGLNDYMTNGFVFVSCGARSRDANDGGAEGSHRNWGKAPTPVVDLKAGIRFLRANAGVIPGDTNHIISIGGSGAGEMSTTLGATGNMDDYYPYLYEAGAAGISHDESTGAYTSTISDAVYACMAYYPITDIDNADIAYAWMRMNTGETDAVTMTGEYVQFTDFQLALQQDEAYAFVDYLNSLNLVDMNGNALQLTGVRSGSYYDAILNNISDALNAYLASMSEGEAAEYAARLTATNTDERTWIIQKEDGSYAVVDLDGFMMNNGNEGDPSTIGQVFLRNKDIPGFDTLNLNAENNAFGYGDQVAVHYSTTVAKVLEDNYDKYLTLMTDEEKAEVDLYIEQALHGEQAEFLEYQTYLMDAMEIMYKIKAGQETAEIAQHWRIRSGTSDQHTSFSIGYNTALAARANGIDIDYHLVWAMIHGGELEGTSTGTFVDWVNGLMK